MSVIERIVRPHTVVSRRALSVAYTPDSDDVFNYVGWEHGHVILAEADTSFHREHIIALNRAAQAGRYDVVGISSAVYPTVADQYCILSAGNSVGRGYGPVLASVRFRSIDQLRRRRIGVGGIWTTGAALAAMYCPGADLIEMRYDRIADAIVAGELDAGVMIHEELLYFVEKGLHEVANLGAVWCEDTGLPLPVGLNVARRNLGRQTTRQIAQTCRLSLQWSMDHFAEAFACASQFGRGCAEQHIAMFSNQDTLHLADDVRRAMRVMFDRIAAMDLGPQLTDFEVING